ncbi:MAG TPA: M23 family metallopeptidase [Allosphingosinicella sp.]|nr:M23 family metallopeptidase [Allosphingosinicella sp.]
MRRLALTFTVLITALVTTFLAAMLWTSLYAVSNSGMAGQAATGSRVGKADEAPSAAEIDAALLSARPTYPVSRSGLVIPVAGIPHRQIVDTFTASRGGGRAHNALDIMAPHGTPVVAAAAGTVEKLYFSRGGGGISAYVRSEDGQWMYYYAHLQSYAPGLSEGDRVEAGDPIGRVGSTGNANPAGPHLHFAVYRMAPGARFYQGQPVNPYPLLAGNARSR